MKNLTKLIHYCFPFLLLFSANSSYATSANYSVLTNLSAKVQKINPAKKTWREKAQLFFLQKKFKKAAKAQQISGGAKTSEQKQTYLPMAVAAGVVSLASMGFFATLLLGWGLLLGVMGIIMSRAALKKIKKNPEKYKGKGMASASLIMACTVTVISLIFIAALGSLSIGGI